jgi:Leucine-rich repeat (LRR) protein
MLLIRSWLLGINEHCLFSPVLFCEYQLFKKSHKTLLVADVSHNSLSQNLSDVLKNVPELLEEFYLSHNFLHGNLPMDLGHLNGMKKLYLDSNRLSGSIPELSVALPKLQELDVSNQKHEYNQGLVGTIPDSFADLPFLSTLNLANNSISGVIPPFIADLSRLQKLDLSHNKLTHTIPAVLGKLGGETVIETFSYVMLIFKNYCFIHVFTKASLRFLICLTIGCLD